MLIKIMIISTILLCMIRLDAVDFDTVSRGIAFLESSNQKNAFAPIIEFDDGKIYAVTTQSVFLAGLSSFSLRDFNGNQLKITGFDISTRKDIVRISIENNAFIKALKLYDKGSSIQVDPTTNINLDENIFSFSHSKKKTKKSKSSDKSKKDEDSKEKNPETPKEWGVFLSMDPLLGIITANSLSKAESNLITPFPGGVAFLDSGEIIGFSSIVNDFSSVGSKDTDFVRISKKDKWLPVAPKTFFKQIASLRKIRKRTLSLERIKRVNRVNTYIEIIPIYDASHMKFLEDHNLQYVEHAYSRSKGSAKKNNKARCFHYSGLKRLAGFAYNLATTLKKTAWKSRFLKGNSIRLINRNLALRASFKKEVEKIQKAHPDTRPRL